MLLLEWLLIKFGVVWYVTQPVFSRRTCKLNGRTVYQRTLWLIGEQKIFRRSAPIKIVLYIRFRYSTPLLIDSVWDSLTSLSVTLTMVVLWLFCLLKYLQEPNCISAQLKTYLWSVTRLICIRQYQDITVAK